MAMPAERQRLDCYLLPVTYGPGASWFQQSLWFCIGSPLLAARWFPGSAWRTCLLRLFGAKIAGGCRLKPGLRVKYPWRLQVGLHCWLGEDVWIDNLAWVRLGDQVCISQGVYLCTGNHNYRSAGFDLRCGSIEIGDGAWIAAQARIAPGVRVGADAVLGLASVALSHIPEAAVMQGNPAQFQRWRWPTVPDSAASR